MLSLDEGPAVAFSGVGLSVGCWDMWTISVAWDDVGSVLFSEDAVLDIAPVSLFSPQPDMHIAKATSMTASSKRLLDKSITYGHLSAKQAEYNKLIGIELLIYLVYCITLYAKSQPQNGGLC